MEPSIVNSPLSFYYVIAISSFGVNQFVFLSLSLTSRMSNIVSVICIKAAIRPSIHPFIQSANHRKNGCGSKFDGTTMLFGSVLLGCVVLCWVGLGSDLVEDGLGDAGLLDGDPHRLLRHAL